MKKIIIFYISAFFILVAGCFLLEYITSAEKPSPIYVISLAAYFFVGLLCFGLRYGEL